MSQKDLYRKYQVKVSWGWSDFHKRPQKKVRRALKRQLLYLMLKDSHMDDL